MNYCIKEDEDRITDRASEISNGWKVTVDTCVDS
jgi:hypothetical protein